MKIQIQRDDSFCEVSRVSLDTRFRCYKGNSSTQSNPNNSQQIEDNRVAASDGGIAASQNSSITINDVSGEIAGAALDAGVKQTVAVLDTASDVFGQASNVVSNANDNSTTLARDALDFAKSTQSNTNDLVRYTNEQFTSRLASNAGIAPTSAADNMVKYLTIGATVIGIALAIKSKKSA